MKAPVHVVVGLLAGLSLAGCVTERVSPPGRGVPLRRSDGAPAALPEGAITQPADAQTSSSQVRLALRPLGLVDYDGHTLPVVAPSGGYVAVQAAPGLITVYAVTPGGLKRMTWSTDSPLVDVGMLSLGRGASDEGVLVECTKPDKSCAIGIVNWESGAIRWLAPEGPSMDRGVLTREGVLIARQPGAEGRHELVSVKDAKVTPIAIDGAEPAFTLLSPDQRTVGVLAGKGGQLWLVLLKLSPEGEAKLVSQTVLGAAVEADELASRLIEPFAAMPAMTVPPDSPLAGAILLLHPLQERVIVAQAGGSRWSWLPTGVISASLLTSGGAGAVACTSARSLRLAPWVPGGGLSPDGRTGPAVELASKPYLARPVAGQEPGMVLIGPAGPGMEGRLQLLMAQIAEAAVPVR